MSSELYFYRVKKVDRILPKVIDIDETPIDYSYSDEEHAADWEKDIGQRCLIKHRTIDIFDTAKKVFGRPAKSMQYMNCGDFRCFDEGGDLIGVLTQEMMKPYYYTDETWSYVYEKEQILEGVSAYPIESVRNGILNYETLIAWAEEVTKYTDEHYSGECYQEEGQTLFAIMKAALCAKAGEMICCCVD